MKIKLDENLPASLVDGLSAPGHDVDTVKMAHLENKSNLTPLPFIEIGAGQGDVIHRFLRPVLRQERLL